MSHPPITPLLLYPLRIRHRFHHLYHLAHIVGPSLFFGDVPSSSFNLSLFLKPKAFGSPELAVGIKVEQACRDFEVSGLAHSRDIIEDPHEVGGIQIHDSAEVLILGEARVDVACKEGAQENYDG